jgi:ABC-type amino acid transport system permease subunit
MNSTIASLVVAACIFGGGVGGLWLHRVLPRHHLTAETQDVIKLGAGMLSVLASLVLGLLIATAKTSYDSTDLAIRNYAAELALLNETLRDFGGPASVPRDLLRTYTERFLQQGWPKNGAPPSIDEDEKTRTVLEDVRGAIRALKPVDKAQTALQDEAIGINVNLLRQRWLLIEQQGPSVQRVVLVVLVLWVMVIFASFGLNAPRNATVLVALLICAGAIGGSIFLILEMDRPLEGVMQISSWPVENALAHMKW